MKGRSSKDPASGGDGGRARRGTGPRTRIGKDRSRLNAITNGFFSRAVVLEHESEQEYDSLLRGLREDMKPEGVLESILVQRMAVTLWRYRRLLQAERAAIQDDLFAQYDEESGDSESMTKAIAQVQERTAATDRIGAIERLDEHEDNLDYCLEKLEDVVDWSKRFGIDCDRIEVYLGLVYGARYTGRPRHDLYDHYRTCLGALKSSPNERAAQGFASEVDCELKFIAAAEQEIRRLEKNCKSSRQKAEDPVPEKLEVVSEDGEKLVIPDVPQLDRVLKYEAHLSREFRRALKDFELLQAMRNNRMAITISTTDAE